jgi:hypothetical protein
MVSLPLRERNHGGRLLSNRPSSSGRTSHGPTEQRTATPCIAERSTLRTDVTDTPTPPRFSSPTIPLYPQCGFSASRGITARDRHMVNLGRPACRRSTANLMP